MKIAYNPDPRASISDVLQNYENDIIFDLVGRNIYARGTKFAGTDTKNTAGSTDSSLKLYLIGSESQAANSQTYSHDTVYVDTDGCLYSNNAKTTTIHEWVCEFETAFAGSQSLSSLNLISLKKDAPNTGDIIKIQFKYKSGVMYDNSITITIPFRCNITFNSTNAARLAINNNNFDNAIYRTIYPHNGVLFLKVTNSDVSGIYVDIIYNNTLGIVSNYALNAINANNSINATNAVNATNATNATTSSYSDTVKVQKSTNSQYMAVTLAANIYANSSSNAATNTLMGTGATTSGGAYSMLYTAGVSKKPLLYSPSVGILYVGNATLQVSDEKLKEFKDDIDIDFDKLKQIPKKYFTWNHDEDKLLNIGTSAQELEKIYPELVSEYPEENEVYKTVNYANLSIVALAAIDKLNDKIKNLEEKIKILEEKQNNI